MGEPAKPTRYLHVGQEAKLLDESGKHIEDVVMIDFDFTPERKRVYIEHESCDCEWVPRARIRPYR